MEVAVSDTTDFPNVTEPRTQATALRRLRDRHAWGEQELARALRARAPDDGLIRRLKERKLVLKDQIAALERSGATHH